MSHIVSAFFSTLLNPLLSRIAAAELKATFQLDIIGVKKNPSSPMFTQLGVMTRGSVIEVNVCPILMSRAAADSLLICAYRSQN